MLGRAPERAPWSTDADDEFIGAEGLAIEECGGLESPLIVILQVLGAFGELRNVDAQGLQQAVGDRSIGPRTVDFQGAAVHQMEAAAQIELVALGVAAEIVVIVEQRMRRSREVCAR